MAIMPLTTQNDELHESGQAGALEITPEMLAAGLAEFEAWFDAPDCVEVFVGMPPQASLFAFLSASFRSMISVRPAVL